MRMIKKQLAKLEPDELEKRYKERTLVLCKSESIVLGVYPDILQAIQRLRYKTPLIKLFKFTEESVVDFYAPVIERWKPKESIIKIFIKFAIYPTLAVIVEGPNSIKMMRKLAGGLPVYEIQSSKLVFKDYEAQFQPLMAPMGTIRGDYSPADIAIPDTNLIPAPNYMHASESEDEFRRELSVLMKHKHLTGEDFIEYERPDWEIMWGGTPKHD